MLFRSELGRRYTPPIRQVVRPRRMVAGGWLRVPSEDDGGEDSGLDRFFVILAGSFLLILRTALRVVFFRGPLCNLYPPFHI